MRRITKMLLAGVLAFSIIPAVALSLGKAREPVQVKADGTEKRVYTVRALKEALEDDACTKVILDDDLMIQPDVDPKPEVITDAAEGYGIAPYITVTGTKELVLSGNCAFEQNKANDQVLINRFIRISGGSLKITGAGTLSYKFGGSPSVYNTLFEVHSGTLELDSKYVTLKGDVKTKTSASAIYVDEGGVADLKKGKVTSVHSSTVYAADSNNYTVYTKYNSLYGGNVKLSENVELDFEKTAVDENSVAALAWTYPSGNLIENCIVNCVHEDLGADFKACLRSEGYKIYAANGSETTNINQKISIKEQGRSIVKQPMGGTTKIGKAFKYDYTLDFTPDSVVLRRFRGELYDISQIQTDYTWSKWGNDEDVVAKSIPASSNSLQLTGTQCFVLRFIYTDASGVQRYLESNLFTVDFDPYMVSFDANGGSGKMDPVPVDGKIYTLPQCGFAAPANKAFDHWEINGEAKKPLYDIQISGDVVVKAIWRNMDWKFTLQPVDQTVPVGQGVAIQWDGNFADSAVVKLVKQVGSNWETVWEDNLQDSHSDIIPKQDSAINITFALEIYYNETLKTTSDEFVISWRSGEITQYQINFDAGEGTGTMDSLLVNEGEVILLPEGEFEAPENKTFVGWALDDDTAAAVDYEAGGKFAVDNVHTFYAVYDDGFEVNFNRAEGLGSMDDIQNVFGQFIIPENEFEAPEGSYFAGWEIDGDIYYPGDVINVYGQTELTAIWNQFRYKVSFNANGGSGTMNPSEDQGSSYSVPQCEFTAPSEHYQFAHWAIDSSDGEMATEESIITLEADITLYAVWELKQYTVIYNAGEASSLEGNGNVVDSTLEALNNITLESSMLFKNPEGKHFKEWAVNTASGTKVQAGDSYKLEGDVTFIAIWEANATDEGLEEPVEMYEIRFTANGGQGSMEAIQLESGSSYALPANGFTAQSGKEFAGWKVNGQGDLLQPGATITISANVELVAQWKDAAPVNPDPVDPEPVDPTPVDPTPVNPDPQPSEPDNPTPSDGGSTPSDGGDTTPTPTPTKKKGCGGSIIAGSVIISITSLLGAGLLVFKKKEDK